MYEYNYKTHLPPYILTLYGDAFWGALFTYIIDIAQVQTGNPSFTASETLFIWLLLGTLTHLFGLISSALLNRYMVWRVNYASVPEPSVETAPMPVMLIVPDEEADNDPFWGPVETDEFWSSVEADDV